MISQEREAFARRIKELRQQAGVTQKEVAEYIQVDKTTYAHYETGRRSPNLETLNRLAEYYGLVNELLAPFTQPIDRNSINLKKQVVYYFPVVHSCEGVDLRRVYPLQQRKVSAIHNSFVNDKRIKEIKLFGSSITMKCHKESDIDLLIELQDGFVDYTVKNEISEKIQEICDYRADILWKDRLLSTERIFKEALKGIILV